ncbi:MULTISPECIES: YolD-like family protein [Bacillus]|uniref:Uncharacterized protein n=1 Tax=Bacillus capparidis TaxID=1840411 RepID=A0ABS4CTW2_9BACI|nr:MULTISPECIES: YolD-like family protein [Bacillus]MBP1080976.1 hypothetical protein [Bacillus capparidis]MED1095677.1 YolD-like family protein [Bacillus capparidis]
MKVTMLTPGSNIIWESSRMMLPEHREALVARKREILLVEKPELYQQHFEDMENIIHESMEFVFPLQFNGV